MIRVASYCRVSTDREDQANSFASQQRYFREYIDCRPDWELYAVYADEGISGTSTKKRVRFNCMMNDAFAGKFDLIITKEVSRFSRNILDTISCTRELKSLGIGVIFVTDGINTLEPDAELRLSIMGSLAQEESRRTSARVKWGQMRRMEQGVVMGRSLLGYDVKNGGISVNPTGAETVRRIFRLYGIEKRSPSAIAAELREAGCLTARGSAEWRANHIVKILKNEKYAGDLVQKKTVTPDYLTHARKYNRGEEPLIVIENHHEPLIDRELWNLVQTELAVRSRHNHSVVGHSTRYAFSGKIRCGECGGSFVARHKKRADGSRQLRWGCGRTNREGTRKNAGGCDIGRMLGDSEARTILQQVMENLPIDRNGVCAAVTALAVAAIRHDGQKKTEDAAQLQEESKRISEKKARVLDAYFSGEISRADMIMMNGRYDEQLADLQRRLQETERQRADGQRDPTERICAAVADILSGITLSDVFVQTMLESMTVYRDRRVEVKLIGLPQVWEFAPEVSVE